MPEFILSPYMMLPVPTPGREAGPQYATDINNSLGIIDAHNHAPGSGVQIEPGGLNINSDLSFNNSNSAVGVKTLRFNPQLAALAASSPNLGCLYEAGVDLYYNDGAGNQIRITQSGSVAGATGTITGLPSGTASASYASSSGTFVFQQATSTAANLDVASVAIRYPGSYPSPAGNYVQLQAPSSISSGYSLTLPALPAANNTFLQISTAGVISSALTVDNSTIAISSNQLIVKPLGITSAELAADSVVTSKILDANVTSAKIQTNVDLDGKAVREDGLNVVVSNTNATNSLSIIRGVVSLAGAIVSGEGFTANRLSGGNYQINFVSAFADAPAVVVTCSPASTIIFTATTDAVSTFACIVNTWNAPASMADSKFCFTAIGQRA